MRIIGGEWRGRRLPVPASEGLRPTPDRVRETLFNWLQMSITGADCLDLFAGTGALGFEAASRGARLSVLVEQDRHQVDLLNEQLRIFAADNIRVVCANAIPWLERTSESFDIIFLDPPFRSDLLMDALTILSSRAILRDSGLVYVEQAKGEELPPDWQIYKETRAGQVVARLLKQPQAAQTS